jgi:hypothetical protein
MMMDEKHKYGFAVGSGKRTSTRLAFGLLVNGMHALEVCRRLRLHVLTKLLRRTLQVHSDTQA